MFENWPVLAICGWSGSGKTTLLEAVVPKLRAQSLSVALMKRDVHGVDVDRPGKDSDRLFRAGADVLLQSPEELFSRTHHDPDRDFAEMILERALRYDLVLVEGHKTSPLPKFWLHGPDEREVPSGVTDVLDALERDDRRPERFLAFLREWLPQQWRKPPVFGCVLLDESEEDACVRTAELLRGFTERVVLVGHRPEWSIPEKLLCLGDVPGVSGPMAGLLAAMRWAPHVSWLAVRPEPSRLNPAALEELLATRAPGVWATQPRSADGDVVPFLAHYDPRAHGLLESCVVRNQLELSALAHHARVFSPELPSLR